MAADRRGKLLIQGQNHAPRHLPQARKTAGIMLKNSLQTAARRDIERVLPEAGNIAEHTKKKNADAHVAAIVTDCLQSV